MGRSARERNSWRKSTFCKACQCADAERAKDTAGFDTHDSGQPASPLATFLLQVIRAATVDDESQGRVLKLFRFVRATWLAFAAVVIVGAVVLGVAVAGTARVLGLHPQVALGLGASGSALFLIAAVFRIGRCISFLLRKLSGTGQRGASLSGPAGPADQHRPAA
jgi:hypothetical protein